MWERKAVLGRGKRLWLAGGGYRGVACVIISLPAPLACALLSNGMVKVIITINSLKITNITIISFLGWLLMSEDSFFKVLGLKVCLVSQSCPALCDPMDCSLPGSSVHGILQARILEWVAIPQGIFPTQGSNPSFLHCRQILYHLREKSFARWALSC